MLFSSVSLSGFEIAVGGITSIPLLIILALLLYKEFGEKRLDTSKLKAKKIQAKTTPKTSKMQKNDDNIKSTLRSK